MNKKINSDIIYSIHDFKYTPILHILSKKLYIQKREGISRAFEIFHGVGPR